MLNPESGAAGADVQRPPLHAARVSASKAGMAPGLTASLPQGFDPDQFAHDLAIVEGHDRVGELLVAFVALARDEQAIARPGAIERQADGPTAVLDPGDLAG